MLKENKVDKKKNSLFQDNVFMVEAINIAKIALDDGNFPVGCVIEYNGEVVAIGARTSTVGSKVNELDHAEINALRKLFDVHPGLNRSKMSIYCTLEPCLMCFGAILISGIKRIVFAYEDAMGGGTGCDVSKLKSLYADSCIDVIAGICREQSLSLFKSFFSDQKNDYLADSKLSHYTLKATL